MFIQTFGKQIVNFFYIRFHNQFVGTMRKPG